MVFVADDLAAWLVGLLADAGRRRLITLVVGSDLERALRSAATAAVQRTTAELRPEGGEPAEELATVISQVFAVRLPDTPSTEDKTLLETLQAGVAGQLAPLRDAKVTGVGRSSLELLGILPETLTDKLIMFLAQEIIVRGARGGPLAPLANQLEHDRIYLQGQRIEGMVARLIEALAQLNIAQPMPLGPQSGLRNFFQHLIESHTQLFAGRQKENARILNFVDSRRTGYVFVEALSGYGKTSLLAHLVQTHPEFHYHFISQNYKRSSSGFDPTRRSDLLRSLCEQLKPGYLATGGLHSMEMEFIRLLSTPPQKPTVIVLDAIDEVDRHPNYMLGLLPLRLAEGIVIILSARSQGDRCYLQEVGLSLDQVGLHVRLPGLGKVAITDLVKLAGGPAAALADDPAFIATLRFISRGDPFYLRFLVEDVASGVLTPRNIHLTPTGLTPYLDMQLAQLDRAAYRAQQRDILGLILQAGQPLGREDLIAMVDDLDWLNFDNVLRDIHRFLLVHDDQYTFCHDRFREYFSTR
jgi:hypothetical protein